MSSKPYQSLCVLRLVLIFQYDLFLLFNRLCVLCMQQFPTFLSCIIGGVLFVGHIERIFWLFLTFPWWSETLICEISFDNSVWFLYSSRLFFVNGKSFFKGGFTLSEISFFLVISIVWYCFSFVNDICSEVFLF